MTEKIVAYEIRERIVYDVYEYNKEMEACNTTEHYSYEDAEKYIKKEKELNSGDLK